MTVTEKNKHMSHEELVQLVYLKRKAESIREDIRLVKDVGIKCYKTGLTHCQCERCKVEVGQSVRCSS
ncbi:unnamed protein product [marine sediment metagenome]|uniref:Uncharacterized protein n=1 Tax=marine sediment metagenome TaxID=412755 RepID=X0WZJ1_9ZZZZ